MKLSGFDAIFWELCESNADTLYGGYSAGICLLGPSLKGFEVMDDPSQKPYGDHETVWDGLGVLDYVIVPHFDSDHPESEKAAEEAEWLKAHNIPYKTLHDGEVIIIEKAMLYHEHVRSRR
jgi:dipeptidase E